MMRNTVMIGTMKMKMTPAAAATNAGGVWRCPSWVRVWFYRGTSRNGSIGAFGMSTGWSRGDPARSRRGRALDYLHWTAIDFDSFEAIQTIRFAASLPAADDRVDAKADFRLRWHRDDWRRRERHHRTIIVRFPGGQPTLTGPTDLWMLNRRD